MVNVDVNCERVTLEMSDGYDICIMAWKGNTGANALVISHGMKEYALRYDEVARFFALNGFAVFAYDHRGHGEEAVYHAVYMDPLTSAVCSLEEIRSMCDELFEINKDFLGDFS